MILRTIKVTGWRAKTKEVQSDDLPAIRSTAWFDIFMTTTPETDKIAHQGLHESAYCSVMTSHARELERERNAAIKLAWELVQELATKCDDPIHKRQLEELRKLHAAYCLSNTDISSREAAPTKKENVI